MNPKSLTQYIVVDWLYIASNEPIRLYYELDEKRYERRKVEEYQNGTLHSADATQGQGSTFLAWEPHPSIAEIEKDPQFHVSTLTRQEFEQIWKQSASPVLEPPG